MQVKLQNHLASRLQPAVVARAIQFARGVEQQLAGGIALCARMLPMAVIVLYFVKSALGMNLLPGPSPLHDLFYRLLQ